MKTFDLSNDYKFIGTNVQKNLYQLYKIFGTKFYIKHKKLKVPVFLYKFKFEHSKRKPYFILEYFQLKQTDSLKPFKIDFFDSVKQTNNNNTYIANIHKSDTINGSKMVELVLAIQKKLNVEKTSLYDGAEIDCKDKKVDLSFFKLIEKRRTFYQKFGFSFSLEGAWPLLETLFDNKNNMASVIDNYITLFRKIKINEYVTKYKEVIDLVASVIKKQKFDNVEIKLLRSPYEDGNLYVKQDKIENELIELVGTSNKILKICIKTKKIYLYQLLIELLNDKKCDDFETIMKHIVKNNMHKIIIKSKQIVFNHIKIFKTIQIIRNNSKYEFVF